MQQQLETTTENREQIDASVLPVQPQQPTNFDSYPDREVLYIGVPYPRSKLVDGRWYFRTPAGEYRPFPFQKQVRYRPTQGKLSSESIWNHDLLDRCRIPPSGPALCDGSGAVISVPPSQI